VRNSCEDVKGQVRVFGRPSQIDPRGLGSDAELLDLSDTGTREGAHSERRISCKGGNRVLSDGVRCEDNLGAPWGGRMMRIGRGKKIASEERA